MDPIFIWGTALIVLLLIFIGSLYILPEQKQSKKKKKKEESVEPKMSVEQRDWKEAAMKLEKHLEHLKQEMMSLQHKVSMKEKEILIEQVKTKKIQDKFDQEKIWHQKEDEMIEKRKKEIQDLKNELSRLQETSSKEHSEIIKLGKELNGLQKDNEQQAESRRKLESENLQLNAKIQGYLQQIAVLKKDNALLNEKKEDTEWVAKSDYIRLDQDYKALKARLDRMIKAQA